MRYKSRRTAFAFFPRRRRSFFVSLNLGTILLLLATYQTPASGHGFGLSLTYDQSGNPIAINVSSQSAYFDNQDVTAAPGNLFLEQFSSTPFSLGNGPSIPSTTGSHKRRDPGPPTQQPTTCLPRCILPMAPASRRTCTGRHLPGHL